MEGGDCELEAVWGTQLAASDDDDDDADRGGSLGDDGNNCVTRPAIRSQLICN